MQIRATGLRICGSKEGRDRERTPWATTLHHSPGERKNTLGKHQERERATERETERDT